MRNLSESPTEVAFGAFAGYLGGAFTAGWGLLVVEYPVSKVGGYAIVGGIVASLAVYATLLWINDRTSEARVEVPEMEETE